MTASATNTVLGPFAHLALPYRDDAEYLAGAVPFILKGLASDDPVLTVVPPRQLALLRTELGRSAGDVAMLDMTDVGRNPGRIIPAVLLAFADLHPERHVRILAEPTWPMRLADEYPACVRHEALVNHAFASRCATIVCPYDAVGLPGTAADDAARTHPDVLADGSRRPSTLFAPEDVLVTTNVPLPPPHGARRHRVETADMIDLRRTAVTVASAAGLADDRTQDLVLALTELASNSIEHAHSTATVLLGVTGDRLVCQVSDGGHITDPLAGRHPAPPDQPRGRGLLLVNQLADLVRIHSTADGTTVEIQFELPGRRPV